MKRKMKSTQGQATASRVKKQTAKGSVQLSRDEIRNINSRKRRHRQKRIRLALYTVLLVCFIAVAVGLSLTVFFNIGQIEVKGSDVYGESDIIKASQIKTGDNLFLVNTNSCEKKITNKLPYIGEAKITRKLPSTLIIECKSTREYAAFDCEEGYILIDENGKVLSTNATVLREGVAYITGIYPVDATLCRTVEFESEETLQNITHILTAVKNADIEKINYLDITDISCVILMYDDRILLKAGSLVNFENKMLRAREAIRSEEQRNASVEGTLDLTIDPYAYFRKGKVERPAPSTTVKQSAQTQTNAP